MSTIKIKKGLDVPINGTPEKIITEKNVTKVALIADDYVGVKPKFYVNEGDNVKLGDILFECKPFPDVKYTSPGAGEVIAINRGEKRIFESIVIKLNGNAQKTFSKFSEFEIEKLDPEKIKSQLLESGVWTSLRVRPFSKVAKPNVSPHSIFITAIDTEPLAPNLQIILDGNEKAFEIGVKILSKLTEGKIFICKSPDLKIPISENDKISLTDFIGPHPAGLVGTHIHFLDPVNKEKFVWHINLQDAIAVGKLFLDGIIFTDKIISLAGPSVKQPRLIKTRVGACLNELVKDELTEEENRVISGSVLSGRKEDEVKGFLGRYHQQVSAISEDKSKRFFGWVSPGLKLFSIKNILFSSLLRKKKFNLTTSTHGGERAIFPIGSYEKIMPLDILPTFLLRSLAVNDVEEAEKLGCLELDEEDLALCTFVSPSKIDYGPILRRNLNLIEKEG
ncbi:MAG: Na(+)-translocating NADH-quinone reductase subunit A [Ignavibacteriales bacterium]|nr:Na(+)-translocating NADH-quinone reductase subunit A [Ignavibacteriales bacterium]